MLGRLSALVSRWDAASKTPRWRVAGAVLGVVGGGVLLALPAPAGMPESAWQVTAVTLVMAAWWVGQVFPMAVTGLVPLVAFPILGLAELGEVSPSYAHPLLFLMLGGFLVAAGMERVGLHTRLVALLLAPETVRSDPRRVVLALMVATAALSGLVSNTATTVMLLPVALALGPRCCDEEKGRTAFVLALPYAASVGGMYTLVGTPPNAVLAGVASDSLGVDVGFGRWMLLGVPLVVALIPLIWWVLTRVVLPVPPRTTPISAPPIPAWTLSEKLVTGLVATMLVAWLTRAPIEIGPLAWPGWSPAAWKGSEADALVAMSGGLAVFAVPRRTDEGWTFLVDWKTAERTVPWSVILLLGGGFALAGQIKASGLTGWVAGGAASLEGLPLPLTVVVLCMGMTFLTELTSNTASTQIVVPLLAAAAPAAGVDPMMWMVPATLSASCAFMMPVATAPNAIATEGGGVSPADMAFAGLVLNPVVALGVSAVSLVLVPWLFG